MADSRKVPIDIAYRKLLEALVDRKIVPTKWTEQQQQIRDGLELLWPALPQSSDALVKWTTKHATPDALTYFDCKALLAALEASPDGQQKNFFGQFTSPTLKKWAALMRLYEKNNVFAAEAARVVAQNTAFEIPFLKKTMQQNDKHVADNKRKILDLTKSIADYKRKLELACADIGIAGLSFRDELQRLPTELPALFAAVAKQICSAEVDAAVAYHTALQMYLHKCEVPVATAQAVPSLTGSGTSSSKKKTLSQKAGVAEVLVVAEREESAPFAFFAAVNELREASDFVVEEPPARPLDFEAEAADIDWDISVEGGGAEAEAEVEGSIDWGISTAAAAPLDRTDSDDSSGVHIDSQDAAAVEIDWDISTEAIVTTNRSSAAETAVDLSTGGFTIGADAFTVDVDSPTAGSRVGLLSQNDFRGRVLNDLLELRVFLRQRRDELADESATNVAFAGQFHGTSPLLENQSDDKLKAHLAAVEEAIAQLTNKRLQQLVLIKTSERYLDRLVASLEMLIKHMGKCEREIKTLEDKNMDLVDATSHLQPQIDALVASTKKLKRELEAALPPLFKGYKVNIVGDVNNL